MKRGEREREREWGGEREREIEAQRDAETEEQRKGRASWKWFDFVVDSEAAPANYPLSQER